MHIYIHIYIHIHTYISHIPNYLPACLPLYIFWVNRYPQYISIHRYPYTYQRSYQWHIQTIWETHIPVWAPKPWRLKNMFHVFFFNCTSTKIHWIAINYFTMHLSISKFLRRQKCRLKKKIRQKAIKAKEGMIYKSVFIQVFTFSWFLFEPDPIYLMK